MTFKFSSFSFLDYMLCMLLIQSAIIKAEYNEDEIDLILTSTQKERLDKVNLIHLSLYFVSFFNAKTKPKWHCIRYSSLNS